LASALQMHSVEKHRKSGQRHHRLFAMYKQLGKRLTKKKKLGNQNGTLVISIIEHKYPVRLVGPKSP